MYKSRCSSRFLLLFASPQPPSCILITRSSEHGRLDTLYALARIFGQIVKQRQRATMALIYFSNLTNAPKPVACLGRRFTTHWIHTFFFFFQTSTILLLLRVPPSHRVETRSNITVCRRIKSVFYDWTRAVWNADVDNLAGTIGIVQYDINSTLFVTKISMRWTEYSGE